MIIYTYEGATIYYVWCLGGNRKEWNYEYAIESLCHRGSNAQRIERYTEFTFIRLSIIDLSTKAM